MLVPKPLGLGLWRGMKGEGLYSCQCHPWWHCCQKACDHFPSPAIPPRALCKAPPCTSELSDVARHAEGSGTSAGLNKDLAKITLGCPHTSDTHRSYFLSQQKGILNKYWVGAEQWSRWNFNSDFNMLASLIRDSVTWVAESYQVRYTQ